MMYLLFVLFICYLLYIYYNRISKYKDLNSLPGPPGLPIIGNLFDVGNNARDVLRNLNKINKIYGDIFKLWIGPLKPAVVISDPKHIQFILSSTIHIQKSTTYDLFHSFLGDGLITNHGDDKWRKHRKLLTGAFHFKILETFIHSFHSLGNTLTEKLKENIGKDSFDIFPYINRYTLDVICETSMGSHADIQNKPDHEYLSSLCKYEQMLIMRQFSLIGRSESLYRFTQQSKEWNDCVIKLKSFTEDVIKQRHKKWMEEKSKKDEGNYKAKKAFLDLLFDVWARDEITMEEIREEVDTFMFAGHDTTSSAISFALFELTKHRDIQEKILEEIKKNVEENDSATFTHANLQSLKYLECVCKEVMRLYCTVPYIERGVHEYLKLDNRVIPKGTTIIIFLYGLHNSHKYHDEPEKFNPERFLSENVSNKNTFTYVPFSAGPRNCIGQRFAMLEFKATLAQIIKNFILLPAEPKHNLELGTHAILKSMNGIPIKIKSRY